MLSLFSTLAVYGQVREPYIFGIVPTSPPVMFLDDHNEPDGFAVELFSRILEDLEISYEYKINDFGTTYLELISGEVDFFPAFLYSEERAEVLNFTEHPIMTSWGALFVEENSPFREITDIKGKKIGVVREDQNGKNFVKFMEGLGIPYDMVEFESYGELFRNVRSGKVYGGISSNHHQLRERGIKQTAVVFCPEPVYGATGRVNGDAAVLNRISRYVHELRSDPNSYYYILEEKWYNPELERGNPRILKILIIASSILAFILIHVLVITLFLAKEVKRQVEEREKNRDSQKKVELKNKFLSSISHELRTPMNIISSLVYLLAQTDLDSNQREKVNQINKASNLLLDIIKNFLDFNRLERGKVQLEYRPFSLEDDLKELLSLFTDEIEMKGLTFNMTMDDTIPPFLLGDPYRLTQIITNLLNNAIKFSREGAITFSIEKTGETAETVILCFTVRDQGIGMNEEQIAKLFVPFNQADESISRQFGGSGLGLAICAELIRLMDGSVDIESAPGEGTAISFSLPFQLSDSSTKDRKPDQKHLHSYKGARLLYVEDNPVNREIGRELFRMAELEITTAENGREAVDIMEKSRFDLVLMDIQMPLMDGLTATGLIRRREEESDLSRTPIVALSAHFLEEDIKRALDAGMDDYLTKPISVLELNNLFDKWLKKFIVAAGKTIQYTGEDKEPIPGIDMDDVMERFGGNYELLLDSLGSFINDYALMPAMLISLESQGQNDSVREKVHTLKGVLGSLGARDLYEKANSVEQRLKKQNRCPGEVRAFSRDLEDFLNRLEGDFKHPVRKPELSRRPGSRPR